MKTLWPEDQDPRSIREVKPNPLFPLGTIVQDSPIQCSQQLYRTLLWRILAIVQYTVQVIYSGGKKKLKITGRKDREGKAAFKGHVNKATTIVGNQSLIKLGTSGNQGRARVSQWSQARGRQLGYLCTSAPQVRTAGNGPSWLAEEQTEGLVAKESPQAKRYRHGSWNPSWVSTTLGEDMSICYRWDNQGL